MAETDEHGDRTGPWPLRKVGFTFLAFLCIFSCCTGGWYFSYLYSSTRSLPGKDIVVVIPPGTSVKGIRDILAEAGAIRNDFRFLLLAKFSGLGKKLQAGEFRLQGGSYPGDVLLTLATAQPIQHALTLPEGWNAREIAVFLDDAGWGDFRSFLNLVEDKDFIEELGLHGVGSLEGYLFPDTYHFTRNTAQSKEIITRMVERFHSVWNDISGSIEPRPDREKTVILASIIEKETGSAEERPMIAGVFLNRLKLGMKLQSDPTVLYGLHEQPGTISKSHLKTVTPYNTYVIQGLPAGPICNPGADSLRAVLFPEDTRNLYFVSKNDGTHQFSRSLNEHNNAVIKYQRKNIVKEGKKNSNR